MAHYEYDIGILGGGAAGLTVASGAAQLGARTLLIEKEAALGGDCLHFGCVPSKTLIKTANVYHSLKNAPRYGLPPVQVPPVDFSRISARIRSVIGTIQKHDSEERFCALGAKVVFGEPRFADEHSVRIGGQTVSAKQWVVATGSSGFAPPIPGLEKSGCITNKEIFSLDALPPSMIMLGAGPIGVEMAQAFCRLGTKVTVVEMAGQILGKEDRDMADTVMEIVGREGVEFHLDTRATAVRDLGDRKELTVEKADGTRAVLSAHTLLVALGRVANVQGLGLEDIGVAFTARGIKVDGRMRTTHRHIYAAGDVNGGYQFTHAAGYEAGVVVANAVFHLPRKVDYTYLPWCTYTDPELASIGMNEKAAQEAGVAYRVWTEEFKDNDRSLAEEERTGKVKLLLSEKEKPIGVQILGPHAGELLSEWVAVLNGNVGLSTLAAAVHPYPTLGEINKRVAGDFMSSKIFSEKVRRGLRFFFHLKGRACPGQ